MSERREQTCDGCGKTWNVGDRGGTAEPIQVSIDYFAPPCVFHACTPECVPKMAARLASRVVDVFRERQERIERLIRAQGDEPPKRKPGGGRGGPS